MTTLACYPISDNWASVFTICNVCNTGMVLFVEGTGAYNVLEVQKHSGRKFVENFSIVDFAPKMPTPETISFLPPKIAAVFDEAEANFADGRNMSAATMYRKAVELAVKNKNPEGKGMLNERIRGLQKQNAVPDTLIDLLDTVKFLGNEGAHDEDPPDHDDVERGRDFTRLFLVYSYELPARVKSALGEDDEEQPA